MLSYIHRQEEFFLCPPYCTYIKKITLGGHRYWSLLIGQIRVPQPTTVYFYRQSWAESDTFSTYSIDKEFIDRHCRASVVDWYK